MAALMNTPQRLLLAGGFALAVAAAPLSTILSIPAASAPVASCPASQVEDAATGACRPITDESPPTFSPLNPESNPLQAGEITSSRTGNVGELPEVNGIPCSGSHHGGSSTGECIGLQEAQNLAPALKPAY